jgi:Ca2+-transporting ATPase
MPGLTFYSNRRLDNKLNVFEGIGQNWFFIGINIITICGQVIIVSIGSSALSTVRLDMKQWAISLALGALSLPVAVLIRLIPDDFIRKLLPQSWGENQHLALDYEEASSEHLGSFE